MARAVCGISQVFAMPRHTTERQRLTLQGCRQKHIRTLRHVNYSFARVVRWRGGATNRKRAQNCTRNIKGDTRKIAFLDRCWLGLPLTRPRFAHLVGWRESAHTFGYADWLKTRQCIVHSRRAKHRTPSARQRATNQHLESTARCGQFGDCSGAR